MNNQNVPNNQIPVASNNNSNNVQDGNCILGVNNVTPVSSGVQPVSNVAPVVGAPQPVSNVAPIAVTPQPASNVAPVVGTTQPVSNIPPTVGETQPTNNVVQPVIGVQPTGNVPTTSVNQAPSPATSPVTVNTNQNVSEPVPTAPVVPGAAINFSLLEGVQNAEQKSTDNSVEQPGVAEILSMDNKEKVNLLTPEQKAALMKKREEAKKEKESYQAPPVSKAKRFTSIALVVVLLLIVWFLPQINSLFITLNKPKEKEEKLITTGTLKCSLKKVNNNYDINYNYDFDFTNSKLDKMTYIKLTKGDEMADEEDLELQLAHCNSLKEMTTELKGVKVLCSLSSGVLTEEQMFSYDELDNKLVESTYVEAGGVYPEFELGTSIDMIETNMKTANYTCERVE